MPWISRFTNLFRRGRLSDDINDELESHLEEAIERGRSPEEARRAFGPTLRQRERIWDVKPLPWLDALVSDVVFGWRQLKKHRVASVSAILSLALAMGATSAAFRLVDAVLWRPLPVAQADQLFFSVFTYVDRDGRVDYRDDWDYHSFRQRRELLQDRAEVMAIGDTVRINVRFGSDNETKQVERQHLSGNVFGVFGLKPALGRLLLPSDDRTPGAHPVAVLSYDFWTRRFARDPNAIGKTFHWGSQPFEIVGVAPKGFVGTRPGSVTDVFMPAVMNTQALESRGWSWLQLWVRPKAGFTPEQVRQTLQAALNHEIQEQLKRFDSDTPKHVIQASLSQTMHLWPAASGASDMQKRYRRPLLILGVLVALVLLIACVNVGNLMTAQSAARAREMALRVSIGAGQSRLIQLVLVESALLATIASAGGMLFATWAAPFVVGMLTPPQDPVRLVLDTDWRAVGFGVALTIAVILLFGLAPALRASAVKPMSALKGGEDPHARRRLMSALAGAQMAFCVLVLFVAGLLVTTFDRLSNRPLGFSHERVLVIDTEAGGKEPLAAWRQLAERIRGTPGVEAVSRAGWAPLNGSRWTNGVRVAGRPVEALDPHFLGVDSRFFETMRVGFIDGRDFRPGDAPPRQNERKELVPGVCIVNEAFARTYFDGQNPVGKVIDVRLDKDLTAPVEIVGYVRDALYRDLRETMRPAVYVPIDNRQGGAIIVLAASNPLALAPVLRDYISQTQFRVRSVREYTAIVRYQLIRERLLAALSLFFAVLALVLAGIGLYGVLNYSVIQQRREIGIRMALGARSAHVVRRVTAGSFATVCLGSAIGLAAGIASAPFVESLLFGVKATDFGMVVTPILTLVAVAVLASVPPAIRAARIDPAQTLRSA